MSIEDQLRAAGRVISDQVRDLPELDLTTSAPTRSSTRPRRFRHWPSAWLVPLTAAAAVILVAVTLVIVRTLPGGPHQAPRPATSGARSPGYGVPAYYAVLGTSAPVTPAQELGSAWPVLKIVATATGKAVLTVKPPAKTLFTAVSAAGDGRTFLVAAGGWPQGTTAKTPVSWYRLTISPGAPGYTLRRLPVPELPYLTTLEGLALSPDRSELAVLFQPLTLYPPGGSASSGSGSGLGSVQGVTLGSVNVHLYSVATGRLLHTWTSSADGLSGSPQGPDNLGDSITWLDGGRQLAVVLSQSGEGARWSIRQLDPAEPGTGLVSDSEQLVAIPQKAGTDCSSARLTTGGRVALCDIVTEATTSNGKCVALPLVLGFYAYSGVTGRPRTLYTVPGAGPGRCVIGSTRILWASPSGSTLVGVYGAVSNPGDGQPGNSGLNTIGILVDGKWRLLPFPAGITAEQFAF